ncbi:RNA-binding motif protein, X-linked 2 [Frankliniella fusca]|uniref:RNA-binding motif protein, X-linked 2 n=1 Tax=Frankliniella fusca TaxID=407009 RepID=A0AAE1HFB2_9NEOP|nr:RNA-binding motif protein, X-linked 2 [Frankliniella fusca]
MNPLTNMKNVLKLSEQELRSSMKTSWHDQYKHSAWIFVGGLPFDLTEGDVICVFSQYGEVVNINLVRDKGTGKSRGFCFICYEDQRSTNLAVDNFNGIKLLNRTIRVDHCEGYKAPKDDKMDEETRQLHAEGCAPGSKFGSLPQLPKAGSNGGLDKGPNLPPMESLLKIKKEREDTSNKSKEKKTKKERKEKKAKDAVKKLFKKKRDTSTNSSSNGSSHESDDANSRRKQKIKRKKHRKSSSSSDDSDEEIKSKAMKRKSKDRLMSKDSSASDENSGDDIKKLNKSHRKHHMQSSSDSENMPSTAQQHDRSNESRPTKFKNKDTLSYFESLGPDKAVPVKRKGDVYHGDKMYSRETHGNHKSQRDVEKGRWSDTGREERWRYEIGNKRDDRNYERERKVEKGGDGYRKFDGEKRYRNERTNRREDQYNTHREKRS